MSRKVVGTMVSVVVGGMLLFTLALASEMVGTVAAVDDKGMATIKTTDGKEHKVQLMGVKAGDKVDCHAQDGKLSCHKLGPAQ